MNKKTQAAQQTGSQESREESKGTVIFIRSDRIGRGDEELGFNLMMNFTYHLGEVKPAPNVVVMMNSGVKLVVEGSEVLENLERLEKKGVTILACGTCLDFFKLKERQRVGKVSNMAEITGALLNASKVITV